MNPTPTPALADEPIDDPQYYAYRLERSLEDSQDEYVALHRDFLSDTAKTIRALLAPLQLDAGMQTSDQVHLARNGASDESLQPLLAELVAIDDLKRAHAKAQRDFSEHEFSDPARGDAALADCSRLASEIARRQKPAWDAARAALGNRTPARQEERPDGNEIGAAPLPVQGQDETAQLLAAGYDLDNAFDRPCRECSCEMCKRYYAALRASSAPTTKG